MWASGTAGKRAAHGYEPTRERVMLGEPGGLLKMPLAATYRTASRTNAGF
jgi:hypothetical protein